MAPRWGLALAAFVVSAVSTPVAIRIAYRLDVVDRPGPLKVHSAPMPYLGGVGVFCGLALGLALYAHPLALLPIGLALALGTADDRFDIPVPIRLLVEVGIGLTVVLPTSTRFGTAASIALAIALTVLLVNAVNLIDGLDALASGVAVIAAIGYACLLQGNGQVLAVTTAAAVSGFLLYNRPPARIYLGDGGAYLLGTVFAILSMSAMAPGRAGSTAMSWPLFVAYPIAETVSTFWRRRRSGRPWREGDREHAYDRLAARFGVRRAVASVLAVEAVLTAIGVAVGV